MSKKEKAEEQQATEVTENEVEEQQIEAEPAEQETDQMLINVEKEKAELQDRLLRLQAEFDNFRKRTRQEKTDLLKYAAEDLIVALLPAMDNFQRAIDAAQSTEDYQGLLNGVDLIFKQLKQILCEAGLEEIEAVGTNFDPACHEAVMQVEDENNSKDMIVEELQKGYRLKEKVVRPSMVKVAK